MSATLRQTTYTYDPLRHWLSGVENKARGVTASTFNYTHRADGQVACVDDSVVQPGVTTAAA